MIWVAILFHLLMKYLVKKNIKLINVENFGNIVQEKFTLKGILEI